MANIKSAEKRARQTAVRRARNQSVLSGIKTSEKKATAALASGNTEEAQKAFRALSSALDKAAKRGVIHRNKADRKKSSYASRAAKPTAKA
jgi:small subunit ribosomal protein S20